MVGPVRLLDHRQRLLRALEIKQGIRLLGAGEREDLGVAGLPGGGLGPLEVLPGVVERPGIDGLPPGQRRGIRQDESQTGSLGVEDAVPQQLLHLAEVRGHLRSQDHGAELPVLHPDQVGVGVQHGDQIGIDATGRVEPQQQLRILRLRLGFGGLG